MAGRWQTFYRFWRDVTRERLNQRLLELAPDLQRFIPPAHTFDKMHYSAFADQRLAGLLQLRLKPPGAIAIAARPWLRAVLMPAILPASSMVPRYC